MQRTTFFYPTSARLSTCSPSHQLSSKNTSSWLNVGGPHISSTEDTGMFRSWDGDKPYLVKPGLGYEVTNVFPIKYLPATPSSMAPATIYFSARTLVKVNHGSNMTWSFQVDSGFSYLLRLFFCEIVDLVTDYNVRVFSIFINNQTAEDAFDVFAMAAGSKIPVHKDYVVIVSDNPDGSKSKTDLLLSLRPNKTSNPVAENTILNGLEIFKLSQPGGSLASHHPPHPPNPQSGPSPPLETGKDNEKGGSSHSLLVGASIGGSCGVIILFLLIVGFLFFRRKKNSQNVDNKSTHDKSRSTNTNNSSLPSVRSRKFSLKELKHATSNFDDNFVIGAGGFGNVYKGYLDNGTYPVAIKRLNQSSRQGANEFQTEIRMLSNLRHVHLVPLIGYCNDGDEMILVYEYMVNGTLRSHLYRGDNSPLSWKQRLKICIGAARGLHYLHEGAERVIMHRDVKSTNILLDEKMNAKVSDFGLSKMGPSDASVTHVSTIVKGTMGYLDPEYYRRHQLTTKSDVYSFGVVMFEVLCARPVIMQQVPKEQVSLAEWARNCYRKGSLSEIVDKNLMGEIAVESLNKFGELACGCLRNQGIDRPSMSDVVWSLEFALQLQEAYEDLDKKLHPGSGDSAVNLVSGAGDDFAKDDDDFFSTTIVAKASETSTTSTSSDQMKSGSVFSEILNPNAR
ncbi:receptor-like protein kinase FERONIA isoform X2 [Daucus carota subsp. sativus]|uniref:receptor-like protein kinase FERONIA isoform X2 n=1 Tax=Daucus carota subsp. sativus TaxID=79200 RepID=UPI0007EF4BCA|nr:PREDICTED: receptor-like protein kinase FERONIA isoform X2 [Daucus carota subsp. sativus]